MAVNAKVLDKRTRERVEVGRGTKIVKSVVRGPSIIEGTAS